MSNITIFCFTTFCVNLPLMPSHDLLQNTLELDYLERYVKFIDQKLVIFKGLLKMIHQWDVRDIQYSAWNDAANKYASPVLKAVRDAVETARNEGRNSSHCDMIATRIIDDAIKNSYDFDIAPCIANFSHAVQKIWQRVEPLRESIERTQHFFDKTVPSCYNSTDAVECLTTTLETIKGAHELLMKWIDPLMNEKKTSYPKLKDDLKTCTTAIWTKIENASSLAQREGIQCAEST